MWKKPEADEPARPTPPPSSPAPAATVHSSPPGTPHRGGGAMIAPSLVVQGEVSGEDDLLIQGRIEGKVDLRKSQITVGKQGRVKADLFGRLIEVEGQVEGNLFGEEQVIVRQSGSVRGNITAPRVMLEDGASFKGSIDMETRAAAPRAAQESKHASSGAPQAPAAPPASAPNSVSSASPTSTTPTSTPRGAAQA